MLTKKQLFGLLIITLILVLVTVEAGASNFLINNQREELLIYRGRTLIGLNQIERAFNTTTDWDKNNNLIVLNNKAIQLKGHVGSKVVRVNSIPFTMEVPIKNIAGEAMVPLYFLQQIYGGSLDWEARSQTVRYNSNQLNKLSYQTEDDNLQLNIEVDFIDEYKIDFQAEESRLVLDLYDVTLNYFDIEQLTINRAIKKARVTQLLSPTISRVIFELDDVNDFAVEERNNNIVVNLSKNQSSVRPNWPIKANNKLIVIDAGHGGSDPGAIGFAGTKEKIINYQLALNLEQRLRTAGFDVLMTRRKDRFISLLNRARIANFRQADLFISIHTNYHRRAEVSGVETYAHWDAGKDDWSAAWYVQSEIIAQTGAIDHGLKAANFAVLRETEVPAILVEAGFLSNPAEEAKLNQKSYQDKIVKGIFLGVEKFFANKK